MRATPATSFENRVRSQVELLNAGKPLEAFDNFFDPSGVMYANDTVFARSADEGRALQAPFIAAAKSIQGKITDLKIQASMEICVFRNQSIFLMEDGVENQIDGLCWQKVSGPSGPFLTL